VSSSQCDAIRTRRRRRVPAAQAPVAHQQSLPATSAQSHFGRPLPKHLSTDHDPLFRFHRWHANLRVREIQEVKSVPYAPVSHPFVERLIGTIRREYLDRVSFWNALDLAQKPEAFRDYCNGHRVHRAIAGLTPAQRAGALRPTPAELDHYGWQRHCRCLFELPIAA